MKRILMAGLILCCVPAAWAAQTQEYSLKNGMKVIVKEDHRAPVVVSQVWYKVGSGYETNGTTGISHVLEHMMFKGTKKHPAGEFSRIISQNGGQENAFTSRDYTAYFQTLEKSRLPVAFELEADRMRNLQLPEEEFIKERKVVMEERRMRTEDDPNSLTSEQFTAAVFVNSPYHHPVIGWMNDLENLTANDLRNWYAKWYAPNNATLVVVGDVKPEEVLKLAEKYFGRLPTSEITPPKPQREIRQQGVRRITVKAPAELPYLIMGYQAPTLRTAAEDWEAYALDVLAGVLDGGDSARFARNLIRGSQIAAGVGAGYNLYARADDVFTFAGTPAQGHGIGALEQAILGQIKRVQDEPVSQEELDRIKTQVVSGAIYELDSVFYQAMKIGILETIGLNWRVLDDYVARVRAVTAEQVQAVARKYLVEDRLTVAVLEPQPIDQGQAPRMMKNGGGHVR
ncbi:MAG: peptidase M16 [Gammaproteobacteria bacterium RBG_16_57_12]|nr:MAG: peptidase M16 [Gammaproteobacteria bacterium RBG_16_57_12]